MKRISLFMALAVAFVACESEKQTTPEINVTSAEGSLFIPTAGSEDDPLEVTFNATVDWTATINSEAKEWCSITPLKGKAGDSRIKVMAEANTTNDNREITLTITAETAKKEVKITQLQKDACIVSGEKTWDIPAEGGEVKFSVNTNVAVTVAADVDWLKVVESKAMVSTDYTFTVAANEGEMRKGNITITAGEFSDKITVIQAAWMPAFSVSVTDDQWLPFAGGKVGFTVETNIPYTVSIDENDWLVKSNDGDAWTLTAAANADFDYRAVKVTVAPDEETYKDLAVSYYVFQNGHSTKIWTKNPTLALEGFDASKPCKLAKYGDYILVANTTKVYALNPTSGEVVTSYELPEGVEASSFCVDDANNILFATDCGYEMDYNIYSIADIAKPVPEMVVEYNTGSYYGVETGNLRVKGDIKKNAIITSLVSAGAGGAGLYWKIENGKVVIKDDSSLNYTTVPYDVEAANCGCFAPLGTTADAGFLYLGYGGDYNLYYLSAPGAEWVNSYTTGYGWMENPSSISTATWNGKTYAAYIAGCHFEYDSADAILLDISNPASAEIVYTYEGDYDVERDEAWGNAMWTGAGAYSDILLVPTTDALLMIYIDGNYNGMACIAIQ